MFDLIDETFHQMPLAIEPSIIFPLLFGARMRGNYRFYASLKQAVHKILGRIAPIRDNPLKGKAFHQLLSLIDVVSLPRTQAETQRIAQTICRHMDLATITATTATQSLLLNFFRRRRHKDVPEQSYCQLSRFPYPRHRQELPSSVAKHHFRTSEQSVCKLNSICRIRLEANATVRRCDLPISLLQQIGGIWPHCPDKPLALATENPEASPTVRQLVLWHP